MNIGEVCSREVYIYRAGEPLASAAAQMIKRRVGALVVVESAPGLVRPIGIVTDRDIVRGQVSLGKELAGLTVGDVMTRDPLTVSEASGVGEALEQMRLRRVRRAPVVSESGDLVGIVSLDDLLPVLTEELRALARLVGSQSGHEGRSTSLPAQGWPGP